MTKLKEKHEQALTDLTSENRHYTDKVSFLEDRLEEYGSQIHKLNEEKLMLFKQQEIMKSKLRTYEIGTTLNGSSNTSSATKFIDKIRGMNIQNFELHDKAIFLSILITKILQIYFLFIGSNFKMEDEEGELFDNTYLDELKLGSGNLTTGRDSLTLEEIQRRNSMVPAHLRSSYLPQYQDPVDRKVSETI